LHIVICLFCCVWFSDANVFPEYVLPQMVSPICKHVFKKFKIALVIRTLLRYCRWDILGFCPWLYFYFQTQTRCRLMSLPCRVNVLGSFSTGSSDNGASHICREHSSASRDGPQVVLFFNSIIILSVTNMYMLVFVVLELLVFVSVFVFTHTSCIAASVVRAFSCICLFVCLSVCLFICALKGKQLKLCS